jgi:hypothetical protein
VPTRYAQRLAIFGIGIAASRPDEDELVVKDAINIGGAHHKHKLLF